MSIKFKSQATPDLVMVQAHAQALLKVIGKADSTKGILEPVDMPAALQALRSLSNDAPTPPQEGAYTEDALNPAFEDEGVSLRKRAWPLMKMIEASQAAGKPVVWGV